MSEEENNTSISTADLVHLANALGINPEQIKSIEVELHPQHSTKGMSNISWGGPKARICYCGKGKYSAACC